MGIVGRHIVSFDSPAIIGAGVQERKGLVFLGGEGSLIEDN